MTVWDFAGQHPWMFLSMIVIVCFTATLISTIIRGHMDHVEMEWRREQERARLQRRLR